jgi:hypothetical protein
MVRSETLSHEAAPCRKDTDIVFYTAGNDPNAKQCAEPCPKRRSRVQPSLHSRVDQQISAWLTHLRAGVLAWGTTVQEARLT